MDRTFESVKLAHANDVQSDVTFLIEKIERTYSALLLGFFMNKTDYKVPVMNTVIYPAFISAQDTEHAAKMALLICANTFKKEDGFIGYRVFVTSKSLGQIENPNEVDWRDEFTLTKEISLVGTRLKKTNHTKRGSVS